MGLGMAGGIDAEEAAESTSIEGADNIRMLYGQLAVDAVPDLDHGYAPAVG
jgi:hypothetical protein